MDNEIKNVQQIAQVASEALRSAAKRVEEKDGKLADKFKEAARATEKCSEHIKERTEK